jgi:branched-chain amino acid transport system substrate-binding protein
VTIFGGDSMMDPAVAAAAGATAALGVRGSDVSFGAPEFVRAFKDYTAGKIPYQPKASHAFDAAVAIMDAYRRAAPPKSGAQIGAELRNVKFQGKSGPIAFDEYGDLAFNPATSYNVLEFDREGQIRVLEARR